MIVHSMFVVAVNVGIQILGSSFLHYLLLVNAQVYVYLDWAF